MKPSTPLPWFNCSISWVQPGDKDSINSPQGNMRGDSEYALHAANAYPRLVEALRFVVTHNAPLNPLNPVDNAKAILRELGELK